MNMRQSGSEEEQNRPVQRGRSNSSVDTSLQVWQNTKTGKQQKLKWNHFLLFRGRLGPMCCDIHHLSPTAGETRTKMKKKEGNVNPNPSKNGTDLSHDMVGGAIVFSRCKMGNHLKDLAQSWNSSILQSIVYNFSVHVCYVVPNHTASLLHELRLQLRINSVSYIGKTGAWRCSLLRLGDFCFHVWTERGCVGWSSMPYAACLQHIMLQNRRRQLLSPAL